MQERTFLSNHFDRNIGYLFFANIPFNDMLVSFFIILYGCI
jgi:hypothetical protein